MSEYDYTLMEYKYLCRQISNLCIIAMAKVGYIFNSEQYDTFTFDRAWMEKYGCCRIIEDSASQEKTRPEWKQLMDCLERGDELVISKFSNALRGVRELAMFLEFCRVKVIRIISIQDKIDSKGELFPKYINSRCAFHVWFVVRRGHCLAQMSVIRLRQSSQR